MKKTRLINSMLMALVAAALTSSCIFHAHHPDPLAGWKLSRSQDPNKLDKAILEDFQDYIRRLPPDERDNVGPTQFFENGTGQHAVRIEIARGRTNWSHVLVYDEEDKRIKTIKYVSGHSRS